MLGEARQPAMRFRAPWLLTIILIVLSLVASPPTTHAYVGEDPPDMELIWMKPSNVIGLIQPLQGGTQAAIKGEVGKKVFLIDLATGATITELYTTEYKGNVIYEPINSFSSDAWGKLLAIAAGNKAVVINVEEREIVWKSSQEFEGTLSYIKLSPDGSLLLASGSELAIVKLPEGRLLWIIYRLNKHVEHASFSIPRGEVATAIGPVLTVYKIEVNEVVWEKRFDRKITAVDYSPDGLFLAVALEDGRLLLLEAYDGAEAWREFIGETVVDMRYASNNLLALLLRNGTIIHLDPTTGIVVKTLTAGPEFRPAKTMVLNLDLESFLIAAGRTYAYYANPNYAKLIITGFPGSLVKLEGKGGKGVWKVGEEGKLILYATPGEYTLTYMFDELPLPLRPLGVEPPTKTINLALAPGETREMSFPTPYEALARLTVLGLKPLPFGQPLELYWGEKGIDSIAPPPDGVVDIFMVPGNYTVVNRDVGLEKKIELKPGDHIIIDVRKEADEQTSTRKPPSTTTTPAKRTPTTTTETQPAAPLPETTPIQQPNPTTPPPTIPTTTEPQPDYEETLYEEEETAGTPLIELLQTMDINTILLGLIAFLLLLNLIVVSRKKK